VRRKREVSAVEIKILLCDDHRIFREGLKNLIAPLKAFRVVGEAADGAEAVELTARLRPDVVVMDISMPVLNGIAATRRIVAADKKARVVALSMHSEKRYVLEALRAGARGYLLKESAFEELAAAVRSVCAGKTYLDPSVASSVVESCLASGLSEPRYSPLSDREKEVLQLIAEGKSTKQLALLLKVSVKTVETHRNRLMEKLGIHSVAGLTKYALREGLTTL